MQDYQPVDLTSYYNAGAVFLRPGPLPIGSRTFHGLPFEIGTDEARCFLGFDPQAPTAPITVPLNAAARYVLFAHTLLETRMYQGEPPGKAIAHYRFRYADGAEERVPIRERFEIHVVPTGWGEFPFLAVPDTKNRMADRYEGPWGQAGFRQTEAVQSWPDAYYLYAWKNPRPDAALESVTIEPGDRRFLVAAITLSHLEEHPFPRTAARAVKIVLPREEDAARPFGLEVEVDRGVANYPFPLPAESAEAFLKDDMRGWGEENNGQSSPAYVEITATPSATVTVKHNGETLGSARWGELEEKGRVETPRVHLEMADRGKNWVHVTVLDDETGRPVPCRIHFRSPEGIPYQPHGYHNHVNSHNGTWHIDIGGDMRLGQITYAYIDGRCQGWLPRGEVIVDAARGFEYEPLRAKVQIAPGQRELTLRMKRWTHMNARRWFSGDSHVHFLGTQGAHREAQCEDLNLVNLLQSQWGHLFTNTEDFLGRPTVSDDGSTIVYCTQENRQHLLGHLTLLGVKEPIMPWCSDGPSEAEMGGALDITLSHWADACHAQGGTVIIPHLPNPNCEPATLIATGRADAVEMLVHNPYFHLEYYRYLNGGYRLPLVGGTDKMSSDVPVGLYRTYAYLPEEEFTYDNWCRAVRQGRTFLSGGPMLQFTVNGAQIGDTLTLPAGGGTVEVEAEAESVFPIHTLQIVQQGQVVASTEEAKGARRLRLKANLTVHGHTWLAARCGGPGYAAQAHHDGWRRGVFAHTSPIYIACGGEWEMFSLETAQYMLTLVEGGLAYIRQTALHHRAGTVTHHHGEEDHLAYLESPFREAMEAIHRRMHRFGIPH
jgi:hypothetical protein